MYCKFCNGQPACKVLTNLHNDKEKPEVLFSWTVVLCRELGVFIHKALAEVLNAGCFQACSPKLQTLLVVIIRHCLEAEVSHTLPP